jgi:hypothetical protein
MDRASVDVIAVLKSASPLEGDRVNLAQHEQATSERGGVSVSVGHRTLDTYHHPDLDRPLGRFEPETLFWLS